MARDIRVTPEELVRAAESIESLAGEYKNHYEDLYKNANTMASTWSGKDNMAFIDQINGFQDDFTKMFELMNSYASFLRTSAKSYGDTQENIIISAKKLTN